MENILHYFEFSSFKKDTSGAFSNNEIAFSELNLTNFLIFERKNEVYNLYIANYSHKNEIGTQAPQKLELLTENYDKSKPEHRILLTRYSN